MGNCTLSLPSSQGQDELNKLCRLITYGHWQSAINRCKKHPKEAMVKDADGCCALHIACYKDAPVDVIEALHKVFPEAVRTQDEYGWLPIHIAMYHGTTDRVIRYLEKLYPDSLSEQCQSQREKFNYGTENLPRNGNSGHSGTVTDMSTNGNDQHQTLENGRRIIRNSDANIRNSFVSDIDPRDFLPENANKSNKDGWYLIHQACYQRAGLDIIMPLHAAYKKGISKSDKHGWLPLHLACYHNAPVDVIQFLIENYPKALSSMNEFDCLPIHLACEALAGSDTLLALSDAYPAGLRTKNSWQNLPIHRAVYKGMSVSGIKLLKSYYPGALTIKNGDWETPLDIARKSDWLTDKDAIIEVLE